MSITFSKSTYKKVKLDTPFRTRIEAVYGTSFQTNQINRIKSELLNSGYANTENEITNELLRDYRSFKQRFPRVEFAKQYLDMAKSIVEKLPEQITAERVFNILKDILPDDPATPNVKNLQDVTIYYWFEKAGSKFTTTGTYSKPVIIIVLYMALRKASLSKNLGSRI